MMNNQKLKTLLSEFDQEKVLKYIEYCAKVAEAKNARKEISNPWMKYRTDEQLASFYKSVINDGLDFDGKHITLISTGVSYDFIAYKNKMFLAYPETLLDVQLVYKDDEFSFSKESGKVIYTHKINNPFKRTENDIEGCYCVIKNKRGEFLTTLTMADIQKHRKIAKTDSFWQKWLPEMIVKTVMKKGCKNHFSDIFTAMETLDNEQNDLEQSLEISVETKQELEAIKTVPELTEYYKNNSLKNAGIIKDFVKSCGDRKAEIVKELSENGNN